MMKNTLFVCLLIIMMTGCNPISAVSPTASALPPTETAIPPTETAIPPTMTKIPPTATPVPPTATSEPVVLELSSPAGQKNFKMGELAELPVTQGQAGIKSSTGQITLPSLHKGVSLLDLIELVGGVDPSLGVNIVAKDGYAMTMSYDQVVDGKFIAYDPATGSEKESPIALKVILAYERGGRSFSDQEDGPLRLAIISEENNQVTDGHWSVKWVNKIELKPLGREWSMQMHGVIDKEIDRSSFQSCSAPGCHQETWVDEMSQTWVGTPLYLLAGQVDDEIQHEGPAYNEKLASLGYLLQIVATDGYSTTLESAEFHRNKDILVAYQVNENPLPDKYFPLRLLGSGLQKSQMIGAIAEMNLIADPNAVATAMSVPPTAIPETVEAKPIPELAPDALLVFGTVEQDKVFSAEDLLAMEAVEIEVEHPKKGLQQYRGIPLNDIFGSVEMKSGSSKVVFVAFDGYQVETDLPKVLLCKQCLLAFTDDSGIYLLVMPGFESSFWVKEIQAIEIR